MVGAGEGWGEGAASLSYDPKLVNLPAPAPAQLPVVPGAGTVPVSEATS